MSNPFKVCFDEKFHLFLFSLIAGCYLYDQLDSKSEASSSLLGGLQVFSERIAMVICEAV
jgi:hypothetical protein